MWALYIFVILYNYTPLGYHMVFFGPAGPVFHVTIDSLTFRKGDAADRWATKLQGLGGRSAMAISMAVWFFRVFNWI